VLSADGFFALNAQATDIDLLSASRAAVVRASQVLRWLSERLPPLRTVADSLMVASTNTFVSGRGVPARANRRDR
jgi:hypothetical protein